MTAILQAIFDWRTHLVGDIPGAVLEIGVGAGENLTRYRNADTILAIEPDPMRAWQAQSKAGRCAIPVSVKIAVAEHLPVASASIDHVVSSLVFCSVTDQRCALQEIRRVLKPGGVLHMLEHIRPRTPFLATTASAVTPYWQRIAHNCHLDRPTIDVLRGEGWRVRILSQRGVLVRLDAQPA